VLAGTSQRALTLCAPVAGKSTLNRLELSRPGGHIVEPRIAALVMLVPQSNRQSQGAGRIRRRTMLDAVRKAG
jgi:hypothetical protein